MKLQNIQYAPRWISAFYVLLIGMNVYFGVSALSERSLLGLVNLASVIFIVWVWTLVGNNNKNHQQRMASLDEEIRLSKIASQQVYRDLVDRIGEERAWAYLVETFGEKEARDILSPPH